MNSTFRTYRHDAWVLALALFNVLFLAVLFSGGISSTVDTSPVLLAQVIPPAEPPEQTTYTVTNLNGSGAGSLRDAVSQSNRYVYFDPTLSGTINITNEIEVKGSNITIQGPIGGPSITLRGAGIQIRGTNGAHGIIIKNIRVRDAVGDGIQIAQGAYDVLLDHVSVQGSGDGNLDITGVGTRNVTVQNSIIANPVAGQSGDDVGDQRNMLLGNGATEIHLYRNIIGFSNQRNPEISFDASAPFTVDTGTTVDMRNNIIWDWRDIDTQKKNGERATRIEFGSRVNIVNNLYGGVPGNLVTKALTVCNGGAQDQCDSRLESKGFAFTSGNVTLPGNTVDLNTRGNLTSALPVTYDGVYASLPNALKTACIDAPRTMSSAGVRPLDAIDQALVDAITGCPSFNEVFIRSVYWDHSLSDGRNAFKATLYNQGNIATPPTTGTLKIDGVTVATFDISSMSPGRGRSVRWVGTDPLTPGAHVLRFCVDMGGAIEEPDETNNCVKGTLNVGLPLAARPVQADLITTRFYIRSSLSAGKARISTQSYVYNQGLTSTILPADYELAIDGIQSDTRRRPRIIPPGGRASYRMTWRVTPTAPGKHLYDFLVDPSQSVSEANETNNNVSGFIYLVDQSVDIFPAVTAFTTDLRRGTSGDEVANVQTFLTDQLVFDADATGYYGTITQRAVREFQEENELPPTGEWDGTTRALANEIEGFTEPVESEEIATPPTSTSAGQVACPTIPLTLYMRRGPDTFNDKYSGGQVSSLQEFLWQYRDTHEWNLRQYKQKGQFVSGRFGTPTENALEFFQQEFGIAKQGDAEFGRLDQKTRDEILRQCGELAALPNTSESGEAASPALAGLWTFLTLVQQELAPSID